MEYPVELADGFYLGTSNQALWPLYHGMLGNAVYDRQHWQCYDRVNRRFADVTAAAARADDFIWVHDYQLSLVPALLRQHDLPEGVRIGFFLHIPFPPWELFRTLPWGREILQGMLGASLVGFHVAEYCEHFFDCIEQMLGVHCDRLRGRVRWRDRWVHVRSDPISIDPGRFLETLALPEVQARAEQLRREVGAEHLVIGVDRLDYTKGISQRLESVEVFFDKYPERQGQVSVLQLAVPSRGTIAEYANLREQIEQQVGHINGRFARPGWTPITYMHRSLPFEELVALYLAGDVALVTPLRDGMNLVAKEYVACHRDRDGAIVLSTFAGAAQQLTEAVQVNPYDIHGMADALEEALRMPLVDRRRRMRKMWAKVSRFDVWHWVSSFLHESLYVD